MLRRKDLPDYFMYRGNRLSFHRLADGPSLGRLDPYAPGEQAWPMLNGHEIAVTAEEIRDITFQVYGITLPPIDRRDTSALEARIAALEAKLADRVDEAPAPTAPQPETTTEPDPRDEESARLRAEIESLRAVPPPEVSLPGEDERLSDWGPVGGADPDVTVEDLIELIKTDPDAADAQIAGLSSRHRKLLTDSFKERMNELNNRRLRGVKLNEFDGPWLENHQTLYHKLAETGDRA